MTDMVEERLRSAADRAMAGVELTPPHMDEPTQGRRRWLNAGAGLAAALVLGVIMWATAQGDPGRTDPAQPEPALTVPAERATTFTLDLPDGFDGPEPDRTQVEARRPLSEDRQDDSLPSNGSEAIGDDADLVEVIAGSYLRPRAGTEDQLIIEVEPASNLPDELLAMYFEGSTVAAASARSPVVEVGLANASGDLYAHLFDGTNFVQILASGMTEDEFDEAVRSFALDTWR